MNYNIIKSGSAGNAVLLDDNKILLDCGSSYKAIKDYVGGIKVILLTHIHGDHLKISTIKRVLRENTDCCVICNREVYNKLKDEDVNIENCYINKLGDVANVLDYLIQPINLYHDVENYGWRINKLGFRALYIVDTHTLEGIEAKEYELYMIEANYTEETINKNRASGILHEQQYSRIIATHLNQRLTSEFFIANKGENSELVELHKSSRNY